MDLRLIGPLIMLRIVLPLALPIMMAQQVMAGPSEAVAAAWFKPNAASIAIGVPGSAGTIVYDYEITPSGDFRIQATTSNSGKSTRGSMMLVAGVLLAKDIPMSAGREIDAIDAPALTLQVVNTLLGYAAGILPSEVQGRIPVNLKETVIPIHVNTNSAAGDYPAPWSLQGFIAPARKRAVEFDLVHTFTGPDGKEETTHYEGRWEQRASSPVLADSTSIAGWKVYRLGPIKRTTPEGYILDYGATPSQDSYRTLGELRKAVKLPR